MLLDPTELGRRARRARDLATPCRACPRQCGADRDRDARGSCRTGALAIVSSYGGHFGEEPPLVGTRGSGTVFFAGCNLACRYCQNSDISWGGRGYEVSPRDLAGIMLEIESQRRHNLNLVSPSHVAPQILEALAIAREQGFSTPVLWNSGGYDSPLMLALLDGVVDIYMPDLKYADPAVGLRLSGVPDYPQVAMQALREMHRQVGVLQIGPDGVATRGLLVRHLVLPRGLAGTVELMRFLAEEISLDTYVNVMAQYHPCHLGLGDPEVGRPVTRAEYREALDAARSAGLHRFARDPVPLWL